ncbi:YbaB/EbfC family nucleoid-associated protein [Buchananella hordeovulneris]|uniref:YbaB/EbfC family DNA-binding protein n=1 Tax=Buchananella hordeovulneris TaxID=52770 RepID=A0A1Q5PWA4_9ACTO|nr:YbaB/EbfC family nucleoid-associated protein [Buchananella hordeovulneris]OKL51903.1 hypothetical protein BSZ40_05315 [Buchananella hordeovulneris]
MNTDPFESLRAATSAHIAAWAEQAQEKARRDQELAARIQTLSAQVSSPCGQVHVTTNANGIPTNLQLEDEALRLAPAELAALILRTIQQAGVQVGQRVKELVTEAWGEEHPDARRTSAAVDAFLAGPTPQPEPTKPSGPRRPWDGPQVLRPRERRNHV